MFSTEDKMRVDKWLWCVRIFKSRAISTEACKGNHVSINGQVAKPSSNVRPGDRVVVKKDGFNMQYEVVQLLKSRVGSPIALQCYTNNTPEDELKKYDDWYSRKTRSEFRDKGIGRPTKKDRRDIDRLKEK
jgi:ribosome-associated heat shock protein Hsp15